MATYVNDLRLKEIATGDEAGTWGTSTNTNLELIGEALGYGTQDCFSSDADATTTVADGATDPARAMYFKVTSSATLSATRTLTIAPNTISRVMFIENATTGSQSINISQGSGANVTIATGKTAVVYLDGAGSGAAVVDAMALVDPGVTDTLAEVLTAGNTSSGTNIELTTTDKVQFRDSAIYLNSSADGQLDIVADTEVQIATTTVDLNGILDVSGNTTLGADVTFTGASYNAVWDSSDNALEFADNAKAVFGAGSDLQIYHDGSNSFIRDAGTGNLVIRGTNLNLQKDGGESYITMVADGAVSLFYDNAAKLATTSTGIDVTGTVVSDGLTVDGNATITVTDNSDTLTLKSTDTDANAGPILKLDRPVTGADDDLLGGITFSGYDDGDNAVDYGSIQAHLKDASDTTEDGLLDFQVMSAGTSRSFLILNGGGTVVINQDSQDIDLRVESDNKSNMVFLDAGNDRIGIACTPNTTFHVTGPNQSGYGTMTLEGNADEVDPRLTFYGFSTTAGTTRNYVLDIFGDVSEKGARYDVPSSYYQSWTTAGSKKMTLDSNGKLLIGDSASHTSDLLQIETPASGGGHGIQIRRNDANGDQTIGTISFGNNTDTDLARISAKTDGDGNSGDSGALLFSTQVTSGSLTERVRIDSSGLVDIGSNGGASAGASKQLLSLVNPSGTASTAARLWMSGTNATTRGTYIEAEVQSTGNDHDLIFATSASGSAPTSRMRIDSVGNITQTNTSAGSSEGPLYNLYRNSASPADNDDLGVINFKGKNDAAEDVIYATLESQALDVTDATEDGRLFLTTIVGGTKRSRIDLRGTETVINEGSLDLDFRVESDNVASMLHVDAGNNRVGIGTGSPSMRLDVQGDTDTWIARAYNTGSDANAQGLLVRSDATDAHNALVFGAYADSAYKMTIRSTGSIGFGTTDGDVTSDGNANRTYVGIIGSGNRGRLNLGSTASNGADAGVLAFTNGANTLADIVVDTTSGVQNTGTMFVNGTKSIKIQAASGDEAVFNEGSNDTDFRVESNGNANMLFVDGGNDRVSIGSDGSGAAVSSYALSTTGSVPFVAASNSTTSAETYGGVAVYRTKGSNDEGTGISFQLNDDAGNVTEYSYIGTSIKDAANGSEDGAFLIMNTVAATTRKESARFGRDETVFNETSRDLDFRVESDNSSHAFFVDGANGGIGFGTSLNSDLHGSATQLLLGSAGSIYSERASSLGIPASAFGYNFYIDSDTGAFAARKTAAASKVDTRAGTINLEIAASASAGAAQTYFSKLEVAESSVVVNNPGTDVDFRVESDNNSSALFVEAGADAVGILNGSPTSGSSADFQLGFGDRGKMLHNNSATVADSGTLDLGMNTGGGGYQGILITNNTNKSNAGARTQQVHAVTGRGTDVLFTQLATDNGSSGGASFTLTAPSNGVVRFTNTSGADCAVSMMFFGTTGF